MALRLQLCAGGESPAPQEDVVVGEYPKTQTEGSRLQSGIQEEALNQKCARRCGTHLESEWLNTLWFAYALNV